jgi:hypothetical protein
MKPFALAFSFFLLMNYSFLNAQAGYVFVKKGIKKKRTYQPGDPFMVKLNDGTYWGGYISYLKADTIYIGGRPVVKSSIKEVLLKKKPKKPFPNGKTVGLIAMGSVLTSVGLAMSDKENQTEALIAGPIIGFAPILIGQAANRITRSLQKGKYKIGKKFYLQVLDLTPTHYAY